jgi:hypothetical protein
MAARLFENWRQPDPKFTHTPIDDLESFLWILLWVPLERHHGQRHAFPAPQLDEWRSDLYSDDLDSQKQKLNHLTGQVEDAVFLQTRMRPVKHVVDLLLA